MFYFGISKFPDKVAQARFRQVSPWSFKKKRPEYREGMLENLFFFFCENIFNF